MTRTWLITWTTYGTWLPGDRRGFVTRIRGADGKPVLHNEYGTPYDADMPGLEAYARSIQRHEPVWLTPAQAEQVAEQFRETAAIRGWRLLAFAVMANHVHIVVEVPADTPAAKLLTDFKAYTTRRLDRQFGEGKKRIWWTERGSTRWCADDDAVANRVRYVRDQPAALVVYTA